jgi:hypothetical protein
MINKGGKMSIPELNSQGELPEGVHAVSVSEIEITFGRSSERRQKLMLGLKLALQNLKLAGVNKVFVDGSFTSQKEEPHDIDGCWSADGDINLSLLDPIFWNFETPEEFATARNQAQEKYGVDFFIAEWLEGESGKPFPEFFQVNRNGDRKGILKIELNGEHL